MANHGTKNRQYANLVTRGGTAKCESVEPMSQTVRYKFRTGVEGKIKIERTGGEPDAFRIGTKDKQKKMVFSEWTPDKAEAIRQVEAIHIEIESQLEMFPDFKDRAQKYWY